MDVTLEIFVYLFELFPSGGKILEFGSGDGTVFLLKSSTFVRLNMMKHGLKNSILSVT